MRLAIAEDSVLLREGLARLLADDGGTVVARCGTADELRHAVDAEPPDVAIVDIRLPPTHTDEGLRAAVDIRARHPTVAVLMLSQHIQLGLATALLTESATHVGYLLKDRIADVPEFLSAVRGVAGGGTAIDPLIVSMLLAKRRVDDPVARLTAREHDVLELIATGHSNQGIADRLAITVRGVERHVAMVFDKLGIPAVRSQSRRVLTVLLYLRS